MPVSAQYPTIAPPLPLTVPTVMTRTTIAIAAPAVNPIDHACIHDDAAGAIAALTATDDT